MRYELPERVIRELFSFATKHSVRKIILFGSRARGNNTERSDVDIAVYGGDFDSFYWDIKENIHSLLMFDVINADDSISEELKRYLQNRRDRTVQPDFRACLESTSGDPAAPRGERSRHRFTERNPAAGL